MATSTPIAGVTIRKNDLPFVTPRVPAGGTENVSEQNEQQQQPAQAIDGVVRSDIMLRRQPTRIELDLGNMDEKQMDELLKRVVAEQNGGAANTSSSSGRAHGSSKAKADANSRAHTIRERVGFVQKPALFNPQPVCPSTSIIDVRDTQS